MHISSYFKPVQEILLPIVKAQTGKRLGEVFEKYSTEKGFPDLANIDLAIFGVDDDRNSVENQGCGMASQSVREYLYRLLPGNYNTKVADLGDIMRGNTIEDTYFAVTAVVETLLESNIVPLIIGGGQDLTYAMYRAYKNRKNIINIAAVDNMFDLGEGEAELNSRSYLSHIILHKPNFLFNFTNIGYQTYFVEQGAIDLMHNLFFDIYRLGLLHSDITQAEPLVRNADLFSFDMSAIRQSDAPGNANATPNGFYGEEACQITRYAGMSDKVTSAGFFEMNPSLDRNGQTAHLLAQMIWYFIDGFYHRQADHPSSGSENYIRYTVQVSDFDEGIVFYKSKPTERWWMEIKCSDNIREMYRRHYIVPCSAADYQTALEDEIPDRWWQAFQKLM
jgi:arginase family enzyme